jgi:hypothetical protein
MALSPQRLNSQQLQKLYRELAMIVRGFVSDTFGNAKKYFCFRAPGLAS